MSQPLAWQETQRAPHEPSWRVVRSALGPAADRDERLEAFAGGVAHDFNNILTAILGSACLAQLDLPAASPARTSLQRIREAVQQGTRLTDDMLAYVGQAPFGREPVDLDRLVVEVHEEDGGRRPLRLDLEPGLPPVLGSRRQLGCALRHLIANAVESLPRERGVVWIRTGRLDGSQAFVEVEDSGSGIDGSLRERIFEPFFTTRFTGRGLGLPAVVGVVRAHRGRLEVESTPGRGTRVRLLLPVAPEAAPIASA